MGEKMKDDLPYLEQQKISSVYNFNDILLKKNMNTETLKSEIP